MTNQNENFVRIAKCRFCGKPTEEILIHKQMKEIKEEEAFSPNPCKKCEKLFKTNKFFIGDCGHTGFIKSNTLKAGNPKVYKKIGKYKIFRMEICFMCLGLIKQEDVKNI